MLCCFSYKPCWQPFSSPSLLLSLSLLPSLPPSRYLVSEVETDDTLREEQHGFKRRVVAGGDTTRSYHEGVDPTGSRGKGKGASASEAMSGLSPILLSAQPGCR